MMKILLVDDHALFREGLSMVLAEFEADTEILQAGNAQGALEAVRQHPDLDLLLLDLNLPDDNGFSVLASLVQAHPLLPVVILSASIDRHDMKLALAQGAMGYIPKETSSAVLLNALKIVLAGEIYIPSAMMVTKAATNYATLLTPRQQQVLALMVEGQPNKIIAAKLNITEATIKMHITSIFQTLDVTNRTQAVLKAQTLGLQLD